ncbi:MAG: ATP-grasp domain-containing protein [Clostridia bacterium]|nr:ATP-grasp domain-containing protein [Clostridia bacterium]
MLINKYCEALKARGFAPGLVICDRLEKEAVLAMVSGATLIINRGRDAELTRYLEQNGLFVTNPSDVTETANDKYLTYERLKSSVPMLETHILTEGGPPIPFPFVAKPAGGHGGNGVTMIRSESDLAAYRAAHSEKSVIQPVATDTGRDMRVYVIGGKPIAAMMRESKTDFRSNFSLGGSAEIVPLDTLAADELSLIEAVTALLPLDYAGVDIMHDHGRAILNEIEDPVGARMLYIYAGIDPAAMHVEACLSRLS